MGSLAAVSHRAQRSFPHTSLVVMNHGSFDQELWQSFTSPLVPVVSKHPTGSAIKSLKRQLYQQQTMVQEGEVSTGQPPV